ncbi:V-set and Ig domain-containing protein [Conger conger]|uniref:V-set and Ig domain-containing protein n=1 Tax=Conger conger TaxID=82655 RepID=UPI002A5ACA08|nr:V-set and Ig domain-containing protein [Conger conger]
MDSQPLFTFLFLLLSHPAAGHEDGWSMKVPPEVRAIEGYPVVLPCSFTHPHHTHHSSMLVLWKLGHGPTGTVLFQCASHNDSHRCQTEPQQDHRFRLEGNPREHDLTLRINNVALQDSGRYFCRVELPGHPHANFENKIGTRLRVEAGPRILGLSVEGSEESGYSALCRVQGSPLPDIQWTGPGEPLEGSPLSPVAHEAPVQHHTSSLLQDIIPGEQYTCSASNPLGKDQATLYLLTSTPTQTLSGPTPVLLLLSFSLGTKMILFLGWGAWLVRDGALSSWVSCGTQ